MTRSKEFGDFQTPPELARAACEVVHRLGFEPTTIVEPTCGIGAFAIAAADIFPSADHVIAADLNAAYVEHTALSARNSKSVALFELLQADVFSHDWNSHLQGSEGPLLICGNPPWVTIAELGLLASSNAPARRNEAGVSGFDAMTGKSNFDVAEWILRAAADWALPRPRVISMLCKASVARKFLRYLWVNGRETSLAEIRQIDAKLHFDVSVSACLLTVGLDLPDPRPLALVFDSLDAVSPVGTLGLFKDHRLVSDAVVADELADLYNPAHGEKWRSGVKHDCSSIMEISRDQSGWASVGGDRLDIESDSVFPLYKSSDLSKGVTEARRWVIVTQRSVGAETNIIARSQPRLWSYLSANRAAFDRRGSSIYKGKPPFSIFGIGEYSFSPWKVAISGLYKKPRFVVLGPTDGKPPMVDDTAYFLPFDDQKHAEIAVKLLNSPPALAFLAAHSFQDDKRPVTADLLRSIDMSALAQRNGSDWRRQGQSELFKLAS